MKEVQEEVKEWLLNQQDWLQEAADLLLISDKGSPRFQCNK